VAVVGYLAAVLSLGFPDAVRRLGFERVVTLLAIADIVALAAIMWVSGGYRSGMPVLMMVMLAGAGLIGEGRMVMFSAALATLAVLVENASRFVGGGQSVEFLQVGIFCAGFFGIAAIARLLALPRARQRLARGRARRGARQAAGGERPHPARHAGRRDRGRRARTASSTPTRRRSRCSA
jgi:two-component system sensor histidine kinase PilS (NtrC family)